MARKQIVLVMLSGVFAISGCVTHRNDPTAGTADVREVQLDALVKTDDRTAGESDVCEVHHIKMVKTVVPVTYGLLGIDDKTEALFAASTKLFPHARNWIGGGCVEMVGKSPKEASIYICPACRRAQSEWEAKYDRAHRPNPALNTRKSKEVFTGEDLNQPFTIHGRLSCYNGGSNLRIWIVGSTRMLYVAGDSTPALERINKVLGDGGGWFTRDIFADYTVEPLEPDIKGRMRPVRVLAIKHVVIMRDGEVIAKRDDL